MMPDFGCGIHDQVFAPNNPAVVTLIVDAVRRALVSSEPRIDVLGIDAHIKSFIESIEGFIETLELIVEALP